VVVPEVVVQIAAEAPVAEAVAAVAPVVVSVMAAEIPVAAPVVAVQTAAEIPVAEVAAAVAVMVVRLRFDLLRTWYKKHYSYLIDYRIVDIP